MSKYPSESNVYVSLGSNLGDRSFYLESAIHQIGKRVGEVLRKAPIYESQPVDFESKNVFLNTAICCQTLLTPIEVLHELLQIEVELHRKRSSEGYIDRTIDLDFLVCNSLSFQLRTPQLVLPHPRMLQRSFQLIPLLDIADENLKNEIALSKEDEKIRLYRKELRVFV